MNSFTFERDGDVAIISFNVPDTMNAISPEMALELIELLQRSEADARCTLLTGAGRGFCSGANLGRHTGNLASTNDVDLGQSLERAFNPLILEMAGHDLPIVTAINGAAAGIGSSIGLMGDLICASKDAYFLQAFINIGLVPDGGATLILPQMLGRARAMELALLGDRLPAETALEWGLINRVTEADTLMDTALGLATRLASGATQAIGQTRKLIWQGAGRNLRQHLDLERDAQRKVGKTEDFATGVSAFFSKAPPEFKGV